MTTENTERDELAQDLWQAATGKTTNRPEWAFVEAYVDDVAAAILAAGYRKIFDGDCGLSNVKDPDEREAAEAWMRWANLASNEEIGAIGGMRQMLTELGYRKPKQVTTVAELDTLPVGSVVLSDAYTGQSGQRISFQRWDDGDWHRGARSGDTHPDNFLPATVLYSPVVGA